MKGFVSFFRNCHRNLFHCRYQKQERSLKCFTCWTLVCCTFALILLCLIVLIGSEVEYSRVKKCTNTDSFYADPSVCATVKVMNITKFFTFPNATMAHDAKARIAHCGPCGHCSTIKDIQLYYATRNTLTTTSTQCALKSFIGVDAVNQCFHDNVGFTSSCSKCWVDNVMCDQNACVFSCLRSLILKENKNIILGNNSVLNKCLQCDEKLCGSAFITCAGANRRRCGIVSDIMRNSASEMCYKVDSNWNRLSD